MLGPRLEQQVSPALQAERAAIEEPCRPEQFRALLRILNNPENTLAVSFGGGGVPGIAGNIAVTAILEELGVRESVREIWGTSAGAIVGAAWASGASPAQMLDCLSDLNRKGVVDLNRWDILVKGFWRWLLFKQLPEGLIEGRHFRAAIERCLKTESFEQLPIPLRLVSATDDGRALKIVHREGRLVDAIGASMCLPGISLPKQSWRGEDYGYFDGGVVEKTPLLSIIEEHHRLDRPGGLVVLCTHFTSGEGVPPRNFLQRFLSAMYHLENELWEYQVAQARTVPGCRTLVLNPPEKLGSMFDFQLVAANYLLCRRSFKDQLSDASLAARFEAL